MSLQPRSVPEVPEETRRVAQAAFPHGNVYLRMRDELGELYADALFADLFPERGQPAKAPGRLALITVMQFAEGLSDRQAADAVRARIDWKYALGLELTDAGFDYSILSEFRERLLAGQKEQELLDLFAARVEAPGLTQSAWSAAYRLDPRAGRGTTTEPVGVGWRNHAPSVERISGSRTGVGAYCHPGGVVSALRATL
jgi:transposase